MAFNNLILMVGHNSVTGKIALYLIKNCKTDECPMGNCNFAWMYAPTSIMLLLSLKKQLENSRLMTLMDDLEVWMTKLENYLQPNG